MNDLKEVYITSHIQRLKEAELSNLEEICKKLEIPFKDLEWTFNLAGRIYFDNHPEIKAQEWFYDCIAYQKKIAREYLEWKKRDLHGRSSNH